MLALPDRTSPRPRFEAMLVLAARRLLGVRYPAFRQLVRQERLALLEERLERVEERERHHLAAQIARLSYGPAPGPGSITERELKIYSQNGEDGILLFLLSLAGTSTRRFIEIGVGDGRECCCANLALNWGWSGTMIEGNAAAAESARHFFEGFPVQVEHAFVTVENVNDVVGVDPVDVLSIDVDGNDYWTWRALTASARVVVIEYNASFGPNRAVTIPYDPAFDYTTASEHRLYHGASLLALTKLGLEKGMALVGCDSQGVNAFFVDRDLLAGSLREVSPEEAWRPIRKRARRLSQEEQERILSRYPVVAV